MAKDAKLAIVSISIYQHRAKSLLLQLLHYYRKTKMLNLCPEIDPYFRSCRLLYPNMNCVQVGAVLAGNISSRCSIEPQQHSKNSHKSAAPAWNQGFVFADAYASAKVTPLPQPHLSTSPFSPFPPSPTSCPGFTPFSTEVFSPCPSLPPPLAVC